MGLSTTVILVLIPVILITLLILAFVVVKRIVKIIIWIVILVLLISTTASVYNDVRDFDTRNTLYFYESDEGITAAFTGTEDGKLPVANLAALADQYESDPEQLYAMHHKIVRIQSNAFADVESIDVTHAELEAALDGGDTDLFIAAYESSSSTSWYIRHLKAGNVVVEPPTLAFRLVKLVPYAFVGGQP